MLHWSRIRAVPRSCFLFQKMAGFHASRPIPWGSLTGCGRRGRSGQSPAATLRQTVYAAWQVGSADLNPALFHCVKRSSALVCLAAPESSLEKAFLRQIEGMMRSRTFNCLSSCAAASLSLPLHTGAILGRCRMLRRFALRNNT